MPLITLEIPLPSLRTYTAVSVVLLSVSVYYAVQVSSDPNWKVNGTKLEAKYEHQNNSQETILLSWDSHNETFARKIQEAGRFMIQEPLCVWTLVNMAYCCLILLGTFIQKVVFGELRVSEQQHIKDKFWNFIFYKFIFVFGIINVQFLDEVVFWCAWFSVLGFLNLLTHLGKDRFKYLSFSPTTSRWNHFRLLSLLVGIFVLSGFMFLICVAVGFFVGFNTFAFMAAECIQLNIRTLHIILRYSLYLYDLREGDGNPTLNWERRGPITYYAELIFELTVLILDFIHHIHMLLWSNMFFSIAALVICTQLRHLFHEIQRRIKKHRNYLWVLNHMEQNKFDHLKMWSPGMVKMRFAYCSMINGNEFLLRKLRGDYPMATPEELALHKDNCAICWEEMDSARKLPCTHYFHNSCLQSWLEQDTSCPTCRMVLSIQNCNPLDAITRLEHSLDNNIDNPPGNRRPLNHFFHFDGSRYVSWLPSFSVGVMHTGLSPHQVPVIQTSQIDEMARQVQQLFPQIPLSVVIRDLRISRSIDLTIENILDGRIVVPAHMFQTDPMPSVVPVERQAEPFNEQTRDNFWTENISTSSASSEGSSECENTSTQSDDVFPETSVEREKILQKKKEQMILAARRKYLDKCKKEKAAGTENS